MKHLVPVVLPLCVAAPSAERNEAEARGLDERPVYALYEPGSEQPDVRRVGRGTPIKAVGSFGEAVGTVSK